MKKQRGETILPMVRPYVIAAFAAASFALAAGCAAQRQVLSDAPADTEHADVSEGVAAVDSALIACELEIDRSERYGLAQDHFIMARDYERRGMLDMAEDLYRIAYDFWPYSGVLRKRLFDRHFKAEEYNKALALFFADGELLPDLTAEDKRSISLLYLRLGESVKAAETIESLGGDMSEEELYSLVLLYASMGRQDRAMAAVRSFFDSNGADPRARARAVRLVQMNITDRKLAEADSLATILYGIFPNSAEIAALLGTVKYLNRDTSAAIRHFNEALAVDSLNEEALRTLAHIHILREEYAESAALYRRLTSQEERVAAPYRRGLAFLLFHLKEYDEAKVLLDTLIADKNSGEQLGLNELYSYRGLIYTNTKRYDKAVEDFKAAIALDSSYEDAWRELCYAYIQAKDHKNARDAADRYIAAFPASGSARRLSGYVFDMQKKHTEAEAEFRKAVGIDPEDYYAWFHLGASLERQKRIDEAADAFRAVLRMRPRDAEAANYLGYMWAEAGVNLDSAKTLIEIALEKDSLNGAFLDSYAWVFYKMGDYRLALQYMNKSLEQEDMKKDPIPHEHLGDILFKLEDYKGAEAAYRRSLELKSEEAVRIRKRLDEIRKILRGR